MNSESLLKENIAEKDNIKLKYKQKLNDIKQYYGIEFDVDHCQNEKIKCIKFVNLKYKNGFDNLSIIYNGITKKIDYIDYDFTDLRLIKNLNHKKFASNLEKDFKLKLVVAEIDKANNEYRKKLNEIDFYSQNSMNNISIDNKVLKIEKKEENWDTEYMKSPINKEINPRLEYIVYTFSSFLASAKIVLTP